MHVHVHNTFPTDLLHVPPGFAEGIRFDDDVCSGSTAVKTTAKEGQIVAISRLLLGGGQLEVTDQLSDICEKVKVIELS